MAEENPFLTLTGPSDPAAEPSVGQEENPFLTLTGPREPSVEPSVEQKSEGDQFYDDTLLGELGEGVVSGQRRRDLEPVRLPTCESGKPRWA